MKFSECLILLVCVFVSPAVSAQPDFSCAETVKIVKRGNGDLVNEGVLLSDTLFAEDQIKKFTLRYAPDAEIVAKLGDSLVVDRQMDIYYPTNLLTILDDDDNPVNELPVLFIAPQFSGLREASAHHAITYSQLGYISVVFSYRSDFSGYADSSAFIYCIDVPSITYFGVQDMRAAIRMFTRATEDSKQLTYFQLIQKYGEYAYSFVPKLRPLRADMQKYLVTGFSFGSTVVLNGLVRNNQSDWPSYLYTDSIMEITGLFGDKTYGNHGLLDDQGTEWTEDEPFPWSRIQGAFCNNAITFEMAHINFNDHSTTFPIAFMHGTCDAHLFYNVDSVTGLNGVCVAEYDNLTSGESSTAYTLHGSYAVSKKLEQTGNIYELYTLCGAGHNSGALWPELKTDIAYGFLKRAYCHQIENSFEQAYKLDLLNFSNQCCLDNHPKPYLEQCDCNSLNPPIELGPYNIHPGDTALCQSDFYCTDFEVAVHQVQGRYYGWLLQNVHYGNDGLIIRTTGTEESQETFRIYNVLGQLLYERNITVHAGESSHFIELPGHAKGIMIYTIGEYSGKIPVF